MIIVFFFNIPTNSYPFQWPLFPLNRLGSFPAGEFISKDPTDFLKLQPACDMIHSDTLLSSRVLRVLSLWKMAPKDCLQSENMEKSPWPNGQARGLGVGGGASHPWDSSGLFNVFKWDRLTLRAQCKGSFVCSGFPLKGKMLVFVLGQFIYLTDSLSL